MKRIIIIIVCALVPGFIFGGNLAVLENLGFSADGRYFMFGQHIFEDNLGQAYAEIGIVNVAQNDFVVGGWKKTALKVQRLPAQDTKGAMYELLGDMAKLKSQYNIKHLLQGRLLYTKSIDDETPVEINGSESGLSFRDFETNRDYSMVLIQSPSDGGTAARSFHIRATITDSRGQSSYTIGNPSFMRPGVTSYSIARVWIGPNEKSLVIAVAKEAPDMAVRYMVETAVIH